MFFHRLQYRIVVPFVLLVAAVLAVGGWTLDWAIRQSLENELGAKLMAVAGAASVQFEEEEIGFILEGAGPRATVYFRDRLKRLQNAADVQQIAFFNLKDGSLLDTDNTPRGEKYFRHRFFTEAIDQIHRGKSAHSVLFQGIDGNPMMSGFCPLIFQGKVAGGIRVDGSATFLSAVGRFRRKMLLIGIIGIAASVILGLIMAGTITRPVRKLMTASKQIGHGNYHDDIPVAGRSELGLLAGTMEEMRKNVLTREQDLKAMLAGVAHEIRNPLGGIKLFADLLTEELKPRSKSLEYVGHIQKDVAYLKDIVTRFLDYAKPKEPNRECCQIGSIVAEQLIRLRETIENKNVTMNLDMLNQNLAVMTDSGHLKQILLNLLQNAIEAKEGGTVTVSCAAAGRNVTITILDQGGGISANDRERIFQPFFTTKESGTGLGLSIVKDLVQVNSGTIQLIRSDRNGTEFALSFTGCEKNEES